MSILPPHPPTGSSALAADPLDSDEPTVQQLVRPQPRHPSDTPTPPRPTDLRAAEPSADVPLPEAGDRFLHFELVEELGRGSFARVFLARQQALANRQVVLKLTTTPGGEPQRLARLQHPNIVPLYSVHQVGPVYGECMPYLGRLTLARATAPAGPRDLGPQSGRTLFAPLFERNPPPLDAAEPLAGLGRMSRVEAALWVTAQVAAGLAHAHDRGILHRDLKPANVLMTDGGVPMILDFNISTEAGRESGDGTSVGGTVPYMAPEHLRAYLGGDATPDARADLFSLGVILYELLTGRLPFATPEHPSRRATAEAALIARETPPPPPSALNPAVTPAVDAIAARLLAPAPEDRYRSADDLHEDLVRQLAHRPLRHAPDRSARERFAKWRRRNPGRAVGVAAAAAALLFVIAPVTAILVLQARTAARVAEVQRAEAEVAYRQAAADLRTAALLLSTKADPAPAEEGLTLARKVLADYGVGDDPDWAARPAVARLDPDQQRDLREALTEVLVLMTRVEDQRTGGSPDGLAAAARWNALAATLLPEGERPAVIGRHARELEARGAGRPAPAGSDPPRTDTDLLFEGRDLALAGRFREALERLVPYSDRHPDHFGAWYARGVCHDAAWQLPEAGTAFTVCLSLRPHFPAAYLNRGLVRMRQKRFADADADLTAALEHRPGWAPALWNRGLARQSLNRLREAEADLTAALADPAAPTRVYFYRSQVRAARGDAAGAEADRAEGLRRVPTDAGSWYTRALWRRKADPRGALADFDAALRLNPVHRDALANKAALLADRLNRPADAIAVLDRLLEVAPDHTEARGGRAVYHARLGHADRARKDISDTLAAEPSPFRTYQAAGVYALLSRNPGGAGHKAEALRLFAKALADGFDDFATIDEDADIDPIRDHPEFARLLRTARELRAAAGKVAAAK